jgi:hypothetical protein
MSPRTNKPMTDVHSTPRYHWIEWPLVTLMALLMAAALWLGPGAEQRPFVAGFKAVSLVLCLWSTYLEWRRGALSRGFSGIREGIQTGEQPFLWLHRRLPLRLTWLALTVLGWWHF